MAFYLVKHRDNFIFTLVMTGQLHATGKEPQDPLYRRLGGPQSRSGRGDEQRKICASKVLEIMFQLELPTSYNS